MDKGEAAARLSARIVHGHSRSPKRATVHKSIGHRLNSEMPEKQEGASHARPAARGQHQATRTGLSTAVKPIRRTLANQGLRMTWEARPGGSQGYMSFASSRIQSSSDRAAEPRIARPVTRPNQPVAALSKTGRHIVYIVTDQYGADLGECGDYDQNGRPVVVVCDAGIIPCGSPGGNCLKN